MRSEAIFICGLAWPGLCLLVDAFIGSVRYVEIYLLFTR